MLLRLFFYLILIITSTIFGSCLYYYYQHNISYVDRLLFLTKSNFIDDLIIRWGWMIENIMKKLFNS